ncbi:MAG: lysophospholipid acyltransferase family protein [Clostridium sp.]|nr:lysophospholipid acyltransferase family protein [Clostridium sp.]
MKWSRVVIWFLEQVARLDYEVLYLLSDFLTPIIHYVVRYRLKIVRKNLAESFPEKSRKELRRIEREFYRNFSDYIFETIKLADVTDREMENRMVFDNVEEVDCTMIQRRSIVCYFAHCGNWEYAPSITLWSAFRTDGPGIRFCQVYRPLKNKWLDEWFLKLRSRFGSLSFQKRTVFLSLMRLRRDGITSITGFMSDQKPSHGDPTLVVNFLNHPTAMITGTETVARKLNDAVMYMDMYKISRGRYRIVMRMITEDPQSLPPMEITRRYAQMLEETIRRDPAIWLWTHKRWKHPVTLPENEPTEPTADGK